MSVSAFNRARLIKKLRERQEAAHVADIKKEIERDLSAQVEMNFVNKGKKANAPDEIKAAIKRQAAELIAAKGEEEENYSGDKDYKGEQDYISEEE